MCASYLAPFSGKTLNMEPTVATEASLLAICERVRELELKQHDRELKQHDRELKQHDSELKQHDSDRMNSALSERIKVLELTGVQNRLEVVEYDLGLIKLAQSADYLVEDVVFYVFRGRPVNVTTLLQLFLFFNPPDINLSKASRKTRGGGRSSSFSDITSIAALGVEKERYKTLEQGLKDLNTDLPTLDKFIVDIKHERNTKVHPALSRPERDFEVKCFTGHTEWENKRKNMVKTLQQVSVFVRKLSPA